MLGGAIQLTFRRMAFDYYPFHRAGKGSLSFQPKKNLQNGDSVRLQAEQGFFPMLVFETLVGAAPECDTDQGGGALQIDIGLRGGARGL